MLDGNSDRRMPCRDGTDETVPCYLVCDTLEDCVNGSDEDPSICNNFPLSVPQCYDAINGDFPAMVVVACIVFALCFTALVFRVVRKTGRCQRYCGRKRSQLVNLRKETPTPPIEMGESLNTQEAFSQRVSISSNPGDDYPSKEDLHIKEEKHCASKTEKLNEVPTSPSVSYEPRAVSIVYTEGDNPNIVNYIIRQQQTEGNSVDNQEACDPHEYMEGECIKQMEQRASPAEIAYIPTQASKTNEDKRFAVSPVNTIVNVPSCSQVTNNFMYLFGKVNVIKMHDQDLGSDDIDTEMGDDLSDSNTDLYCLASDVTDQR